MNLANRCAAMAFVGMLLGCSNSPAPDTVSEAEFFRHLIASYKPVPTSLDLGPWKLVYQWDEHRIETYRPGRLEFPIRLKTLADLVALLHSVNSAEDLGEIYRLVNLGYLDEGVPRNLWRMPPDRRYRLDAGIEPSAEPGGLHATDLTDQIEFDGHALQARRRQSNRYGERISYEVQISPGAYGWWLSPEDK